VPRSHKRPARAVQAARPDDRRLDEAALAADNFGRLLAILERNAASVQHEPELARRLRETIARLRAAKEIAP
jgi:23S rRNA G2069 N7-methylase RlmK/C1962 C5-methylase RlmI